MKKLSELSDDTMLVVTPKDYDCEVMDKEEFMQSSYFLDMDDVKVTIAREVYASFDLEYALQIIGEDDMHECWLENVIDKFSKEARLQIENTINSVLKTEPTYYDGEEVDWLS